jgi:hypothetical protein
VYQIFLSGGWLMWPILLCSIMVVAISIERFLTLRSERIVPTGQLAGVWTQLLSKELDNSEQLAKLRDSSPLGYILAAGISNAGHGRDVMKDSIEESAGQVVHSLERFLAILGSISNTAPLHHCTTAGVAGYRSGHDSSFRRYHALRHWGCVPASRRYFSGFDNHSSGIDCGHSGNALTPLF